MMKKCTLSLKTKTYRNDIIIIYYYVKFVNKFMINYRLFKYPFFRYFLYNMLYSLIFCWIPLLLYTLLIIHIVTKSGSDITIQDIMNSGISVLKDRTILLNNLEFIEIILIVICTILCNIGYIYMNKVILTKVFFDNYKYIVLSNRRRHISWTMSTIFSLANTLLSSLGTLCVFSVFLILKNKQYDVYFYSLQVLSFIVSWDLTYVLLNKCVEYLSVLKVKPLKN